jgi:hypothetical protein
MSGNVGGQRVYTISQDRVRDALDYDPETGIFLWKNPNKFGPRRTGQIAGCIQSTGYRRIMIDYVRYFEQYLAWVFVYGTHPVNEIDHINKNPGDNRIRNLREATRSQNEQNKGKPITNTSGIRGVVWCASREKWQAQLMLDKKMKFLGRYNTKEEAVIARKSAEKEFYGEFAP